MSQEYTPEQVEAIAAKLADSISIDNGKATGPIAAPMLRAYAATLRQAARVDEAVPNDDAGHEWVTKHHLFVYEVDFGSEGKGRYVRLNDFNRVVAALEAALSAQPAPGNTVAVDRGALQMALNVLRRAGKDEVAEALEQSAQPAERGEPAGHIRYEREGDFLRIYGDLTAATQIEANEGDPLYLHPAQPAEQGEAEATGLWIQFSGNGENIRFWTRDPDRARREMAEGRPLIRLCAARAGERSRKLPDWASADVRNEADSLDPECDLTAITMLRDFADLLDETRTHPAAPVGVPDGWVREARGIVNEAGAPQQALQAAFVRGSDRPDGEGWQPVALLAAAPSAPQGVEE